MTVSGEAFDSTVRCKSVLHHRMCKRMCERNFQLETGYMLLDDIRVLANGCVAVIPYIVVVITYNVLDRILHSGRYPSYSER